MTKKKDRSNDTCRYEGITVTDLYKNMPTRGESYYRKTPPIKWGLRTGTVSGRGVGSMRLRRVDYYGFIRGRGKGKRLHRISRNRPSVYFSLTDVLSKYMSGVIQLSLRRVVSEVASWAPLVVMSIGSNGKRGIRWWGSWTRV